MNRDIGGIRPATAGDQGGISALVCSEALNPNDLDWRRFVVATDGGRIVGAVQMRRHADGARELGSLVVCPHARGLGIAARLIDRLLAAERGRVLMITDSAFAAHYARWGFRRIGSTAAPRSIRRNYCLGQLAGIITLLKGRLPKRLVILNRDGA